MDKQERLSLVWSRIVPLLQDLVRELEITQDELHVAADYLTRTAKAGVMRSLLDSTLSMAAVEAVEGRIAGTRPNPEGPYFRLDAPLRPDGSLLEQPPGENAEVLTVRGRVLDGRSGRPIPGAELHLWQADENGIYDVRGSHLRGRVRADEQGRYAFTTVVPADYREHDKDPLGELYAAMGRQTYRAGHIHVKVFVDSREVLTTQMYMADAPNLACDYVLGAVSDDLVVARKPDVDGRSVATFDFFVVLHPVPAASR